MLQLPEYLRETCCQTFFKRRDLLREASQLPFGKLCPLTPILPTFLHRADLIPFYLESHLEFMVLGFPLIATRLEKYRQLPHRTLQFMLRRTHLADSLPSLVPQSD
jgi:hypothetical protein